MGVLLLRSTGDVGSGPLGGGSVGIGVATPTAPVLGSTNAPARAQRAASTDCILHAIKLSRRCHAEMHTRRPHCEDRAAACSRVHASGAAGATAHAC